MNDVNGKRGYLPPEARHERIDLDRLREVIAAVESEGGTEITAIELLDRLGITDDELDLLKFARRLAAASAEIRATPDGSRRRTLPTD
jgi:hypothetical protein